MRIVQIIGLMVVCMLNGLVAQTFEDAARILDNELGFGARALGMGGAYTGVADDYSAVYWNPAGLAMIRKTEMFLDFSHVRFNNDVTYQGNLSTPTTSSTKFNSIGLVMPVPTARGSLVFALGYQRVKDFDYINEFQGVSNADNDLSFILDSTNQVYDFFGENVTRGELITDEGSMNQYNLSGAIDISPNASFGVALNYWTGKSEYSLDFTQTDTENNFPDFPADFYQYQENRTINAEYSAFNVVLSGIYRIKRLARIGITYSTPLSFNVNENYINPASLEFDNGDMITFDSNEGEYEYDVQIPFEVSAGASVDLGLGIISGSVRYRDWSKMKFKSPSELLEENSFIKSNYREVLRLNLGAEAKVPFTSIRLRGGFMYLPNPLKNTDPEAVDSDRDRKYVTAGAGFLIDRYIKLDFAAAFGFWKQVSSDDLAPEVTSEDILYQKYMLTFSYRF